MVFLVWFSVIIILLFCCVRVRCWFFMLSWCNGLNRFDLIFRYLFSLKYRWERFCCIGWLENSVFYSIESSLY